MTSCRGMYFSAENTDSRFVQQAGSHVIATARDLNDCWQRFVFLKELMHAFDDPKAAADNGQTFDTQLQDLSGPSNQLSPQGEAEYLSFWMALGVLCPEELRQSFAARLEAKQIDHYTIALELKIPQLYVPLLFENRYEHIIKSLTSK